MVKGNEAAAGYKEFLQSDAVREIVAKAGIPATTTKTLTIDLIDKNSPRYTFQGEWSGRDVKVVMRTVWRQYLLTSRTQRRLTLADLSDNTITPTTTEAANGK